MPPGMATGIISLYTAAQWRKRDPRHWIAQKNIASRGGLHVLVNASVSTPVLWDESQGIIIPYFRPPPKQHIMNQKRLKE